MKPHLLIYDGECPFCHGWAYRLQGTIGSRLQIEPYQKAAKLFPDVPAEQWVTAVALADPEGRLHWGAEAVVQVLAIRWVWRWLPGAYRWTPGARWVGERIYQFVAKRRKRVGCEACGY